MKYLKIQNNGELDIRLVALMGGTTKAGDKYKIGQFGTGLKYTLAFLFRSNLLFKIFCGEEEVKLHIETEVIKDQDFDIICINGNRTSITTKMGESWEAWMIIREIWCNALDEGGSLREITTDVSGEANKTSFYIQIDSRIQEIINHWDKYFLHDAEPLFESSEYRIYPGGEMLRLYKNGVLIHEEEAFKGLFSYDVLGAEINELREFKGHMGYDIAHALANTNERVASYFLENISADHYEGSGNMTYDWYNTWGQAWVKSIGSAKLIHDEALENIRAKEIDIDTSGMIIVPKCVYSQLTKQFKGISALMVASKTNEFYEKYDERVEKKLKQAFVILESCNYLIHPELKFVFGFFEDKTRIAQVNRDTKQVCMSNTLLSQPLINIVCAVIEENEHFNTGFSDCSRSFQSHFIMLYSKQLLATHQIEI